MTMPAIAPPAIRAAWPALLPAVDAAVVDAAMDSMTRLVAGRIMIVQGIQSSEENWEAGLAGHTPFLCVHQRIRMPLIAPSRLHWSEYFVPGWGWCRRRR